MYIYPATPEVSITSIELTDESVNVTWELVQGDITSLSLGWQEDEQTQQNRKKRSAIDGYQIIASNIPPNQYVIYVNYSFDTGAENEFTLFVYEEGNVSPTGQSPRDQGVVMGAKEPPGNMSGCTVIKSILLCVNLYYDKYV